MSASMFGILKPLLFDISRLKGSAICLSSVRCASKKAGTSTRNRKGTARGKSRCPKKNHGDFVHKGETLCTQLGLNYYPGENVRCHINNTLYAMVDGEVIVSGEKLNPYPNSPLYPAVQSGVEIYKQFFHVHPVPLHAKFKLKFQV